MSTDVLNGLVLAYLLGMFTRIAIQFCRDKIPGIKAEIKMWLALRKLTVKTGAEMYKNKK